MSRAVTIGLFGALAMGAPHASRAQQPAKPNAGTPAKADAIDATTRAEILAARDAIWRAWFANDTAALGRLLPRSTTAGEGGGWETRDEIVAESARSAASGRRLVSLRFDDTRIHTNGNVAVVFSNYSLELEGNGQRGTVTGNASEVFVRTDGIWRNPFWYLGPPPTR
jgi:hypothetical protein